jgi:putative ABC transport system permease protein
VRGFWQDLRFGLRVLRKAPGFTAVAVLTLALGIGLNAAAFSIVHAVLLRPLPYADSERLLSVSSKPAMFPDMTLNLSWPAFERVRAQVGSFSGSAAYRSRPKTLSGRENPALLETAEVSDRFFEQFGARPRLGRLLGDADREERAGKVVVLGEGLWRARFAKAPNIVGRTISLDAEPYTVVGIAAGRFSFPGKTDAWTPLAVRAEVKTDPAFYAFGFVGKLRPGADEKRLNAELRAVAGRMEREFPKLKAGYELAAARLIEGEVGGSRLPFDVLLGAAALVLLIACTNVASLSVARGWGRQQEMAVRAALGASKGRLFRQLTVESCLLGLLGGAAGVALAAGAVKIFAAVAPEDTPRLAEIRPDWPLAAAALACALGAGLWFGFFAARHAVDRAPQVAPARVGALGPIGSRLGGVLVAGQIALALVLVIGAGLMLETLEGLLDQSPGFRTENLLALDLAVPGGEGREPGVRAEAERTRDLIEQIGGLPGVEAAAAANYGLLDGTIFVHGGLRVEGSPSVVRDAGFAVRERYVSPGYFTALGQPLLRGRFFRDADRAGSPSVAIVNAGMARKYWGTLDVLGKRFTTSTQEKGREPWSEIVGVVTDVREFLVREQPVPEYYLPLYQREVKGASLLVRTSVRPETLVDALTKRIWQSYPALPVSHVTTVGATIEQSVGNERLHTFLLGAFAGTGWLMALVGTYGVIAYAVERRTREIGLRISLGATRRDVFFLAGGNVLVPVLVGIAAGIGASLLAQRAIASELYGVQASDPATFGLAAGAMILAAGLAGWIPARRAARVDPAVALRCE